MHWSSKMQTEIALSTTEAEYIALSQAMREVLPIIWLMEEARKQNIPVLNATVNLFLIKNRCSNEFLKFFKIPTLLR